MARHNKTISCICGTKAEKVKGFALTQTAKECVCTEIKNGKEKDLGFPVTVNITRDTDEPKRQRRERK